MICVCLCFVFKILTLKKKMESFKTPVKLRNKVLDVIKIPASPLMKKIGFGTCVAIYEMQRSPVSSNLRSPWAIKKLIKRQVKQDTAKYINERILSEAEVLRKLNHPNIVGFRAFVKDDNGLNVLAMEECTNCLGNMIESRFETEDLTPYPAETITKVSYDVAKALKYLHDTALLLHCDIKSYNVLVKGDFIICKICDFGVCLPLAKSGMLDIEKAGDEAEYSGTTCWCAPEILQYPQVITSSADVYSFGLTIWEMLALSPPADEVLINSFDNESNLDTSVVNEAVRQRLPLPDVELGPEYNMILEVYYCCTLVNWKKRPTARDLVLILEELVTHNAN